MFEEFLLMGFWGECWVFKGATQQVQKTGLHQQAAKQTRVQLIPVLYGLRSIHLGSGVK